MRIRSTLRSFVALCALASFTVVGAVATSQDAFGVGEAGKGGIVPTLTCTQAYMGNGQFALQIKNGVGGGGGFLAISLARTDSKIGNANLYLNLGALILFLPVQLNGTPGVAGAGSAIVPLPLVLSPDPNLAGAEYYAQYVGLDFVNPGTPAATRGLKIELTYPPAVFVGLSVGGGADRHYFVDPLTQMLLHQGGLAQTDNVTDARWAYGGTGLFVGSSIRNTVNFADTKTFPPMWRTIYTSSGSGCYGIGYDKANGIIYTLTNPGTNTREITAIDAKNPSSPQFGQKLGNTVNAFGGTNLVERWSLSPSGKRAVVLAGLFGTVPMKIIDTDPGSTTYLNVLTTSNVPLSGFTIPTRAVYNMDEDQIIVIIQLSGQTPGEIARYDVPTGLWLDHNPNMPGIQNIGPNSLPAATLGSAPTDIEIAPDGTFAIISGFGGTGWTGRLDLSPGNPSTFSYTPINLSAPLNGAWACGLARDGRTMSVGTFGATDQLVLADPLAGTQLGTVALPGASNLYTIKHR